MKSTKSIASLAWLVLAFSGAAMGQTKAIPCEGAAWHPECPEPGKPPNTRGTGDTGDTGATAQALGVIGNILDVMQAGKQGREQREAAMNTKREADTAEAAALLQRAQQSGAYDPWANAPLPDSKPHTEGLKECDLDRIVDTCLVSYSLTNVVDGRARKDGVALQSGSADLTFTSTAPRCSRVHYFVDNTPYFTLMKNGNTAQERVVLARTISKDMISIERCEVFATAPPK